MEVQQLMAWTKGWGVRKLATGISAFLLVLGLLSVIGVVPDLLSIPLVGVLAFVSLLLSYLVRATKKALANTANSGYTLDVVGQPRRSGSEAHSGVLIGGLKLGNPGEDEEFDKFVRRLPSGTTSLSCVVVNQKSGLLAYGGQPWGFITSVGGKALERPVSSMVIEL